MYFISF